MAIIPESNPRCKNLVLDAGPLLSLSPLRGLAVTYLTVPQVLDELKDKRAREHFEQLGLSTGVNIQIRSPTALSLSHVIQFAKKTGDYSVLSHADLLVLALTYELDQKAKQELVKEKLPVSEDETASPPPGDQELNELSEQLKPISFVDESTASTEPATAELTEVERSTAESEVLDADFTQNDEPEEVSDGPLYDDPSESDDGDGEWITPSNVSLHKSRALNLLPSADAGQKGKGRANDVVEAGCMTADFAMQNVLLQMGLSLVGVDGKRIQRVKTWVLRCHACFKICKDNSKKFCPSCGNPSLLRASVTIAAPNASADAPVMQIHLKKNFQYKIRGTKYSIPAPKPGSAKHGPGEGLILREDQSEYMRAKKLADGKRAREEQKMVKGLMETGAQGGVRVGSWMDPDWMPDLLTAGTGGKGRTVRVGGKDGDMPVIGYGRKNPNERRRKK